MPKIYELLGYQISIWSLENGEPIHVHVSKRRPSANATKIWLLSDGTFQIGHNASRIPQTDLSKIVHFLNYNAEEIKDFWIAYHGYEKYIK